MAAIAVLILHPFRKVALPKENIDRFLALTRAGAQVEARKGPKNAPAGAGNARKEGCCPEGIVGNGACDGPVQRAVPGKGPGGMEELKLASCSYRPTGPFAGHDGLCLTTLRARPQAGAVKGGG